MTSSDLGTPRPPATASPRRLARLAAAVALSFASLLYGGLWSWQTLREYDVLSDRLGLAHDALASRRVELGFDIEYSARLRAVSVTGVRRDTPAEAAGVRTGDRIVAVDGRAVRDSAAPFGEIYLERQAGDTVDLAVVRGDARQPVVLRAVFRARTLPRSLPALLRLVFQSRILFPFVMLAVALPVLFYRVDDAHAWRLALLFAGLIAAPGFPNDFAGVEGPLRAFATCYRSLLGGLSGALFYWFFAAFPTRSAFDRHLPALKWLLLGMGLLFGAAGLGQGSAWLPASAASWLGAAASRALWLAYSYGATAFALAALAQSAHRPPTADARRKIQVIAWGTLVGVVPAVALALVGDLGWPLPEWSGALVFLLLFLFPLSFAYAVVRHRVLELPVLLKRSARYLLVRRGFVVLLVLLALAANALFAYSFTRLFRVDPTSPPSWASASASCWPPWRRPACAAPPAHRPRVLPRGVRRARDPRAAGRAHPTVDEPLRAGGGARTAAHGGPAAGAVAVYLRSPQGARCAAVRDADRARRARGGRRSSHDLASDGRPAGGPARDGEPIVPPLAPLAPECVVPIAARGRAARAGRARAAALEEPYSGEDRRLLAAVAGAGGGRAREREPGLAHRRAARPSGGRAERARAPVQAQLLPRGGRRLPRSSARAAACRHGRWAATTSISWTRPGGRLGLVLADVSGKGFAAALLMASLQASLRTLSAGREPLAARLAEVNRLLLEASEPSRYATLFVGEYDDASAAAAAT